VYDRQANRWAADYNMVISIDGEARDRETADAFRDALTKDPFYTASTAGADRTGGRRLPFGFTYRLRTAVGSPMQAADTAKETPTGAGAGSERINAGSRRYRSARTRTVGDKWQRCAAVARCQRWNAGGRGAGGGGEPMNRSLRIVLILLAAIAGGLLIFNQVN